MPPINWGELKAAAIALSSVTDAARRASVTLPESEQQRFIERVKKRAYRQRWLDNAKALKLTAATNAKPMSTAVLSGSDALATALADDNRETKLSLSKGVRRAAKYIETLPDPLLLTGADKVRQIVSSASTIHGWEEKQQQGVGLVNVTLIRVELLNTEPVRLVEAS